MIARELISDTVPSVTSRDPAGRALEWMGEFKLNQLPIVDEGAYLGMITENDILDADDLNLKVGDLKFAGWDSAYTHEGNHVYDVIKLMSEMKLELLPVLAEDDLYLGVITLRDVAKYMGKFYAIQDPGSVLVLKIPPNSYALSEIGRIVEEAGAKVLSLYISPIPDRLELQLTLKLNLEDISRVVASFERYDYDVLQTYRRNEHSDDLSRNLDALIRFLDI
jgi:CBS domain-containing protein